MLIQKFNPGNEAWTMKHCNLNKGHLEGKSYVVNNIGHVAICDLEPKGKATLIFFIEISYKNHSVRLFINRYIAWRVVTKISVNVCSLKFAI